MYKQIVINNKNSTVLTERVISTQYTEMLIGRSIIVQNADIKKLDSSIHVKMEKTTHIFVYLGFNWEKELELEHQEQKADFY